MKAPPGFIVAIDGPSGAGKTAAGMLVAERIGAVFVDTGIFYRGLTLLALRQGVPSADAAALAALAGGVTGRAVEPAAGCRFAEVWVNGEPAGEAIRTSAVEASVSQVASHPEVRGAILNLQREAAGVGPAIVAGRDIGTVIFPEAPLKVYLDASPQARAHRRARQLGARNLEQEVAQNLAARDASDAGRTVAPLSRAADAVVIDTDRLSLEEVVAELEGLVSRRLRGVDGRR